MTLAELYADDQEMLGRACADLQIARDSIQQWLDGEAVDPDDAHYLGMVLLSLSQRASGIGS